MYSTLTPLAEQGRGHRRWLPTLGWFLVGAAAGGAMLGSSAAAGAALLSALHLGRVTVIGVAAAAFAVAFAFDEGLLRPALPYHRRQVDERWLDRYRRWVYAGGFGLQIGTGLATYVMTAGVYLVILLGALTARPVVAFAVGVVFGATRGSALLLAARLDRPERLRAFHRRFASLDAPIRHVVAACWALGAVVAAAAGGAGILVPVLLAVTILALISVRSSARRGRACTPGVARAGGAATSGPAGAAGSPGPLDPMRPLIVAHRVGEERIELRGVEEPTMLPS